LCQLFSKISTSKELDLKISFEKFIKFNENLGKGSVVKDIIVKVIQRGTVYKIFNRLFNDIGPEKKLDPVQIEPFRREKRQNNQNGCQ
jgi:hypothetical protein